MYIYIYIYIYLHSCLSACICIPNVSISIYLPAIRGDCLVDHDEEKPHENRSDVHNTMNPAP